METSSFLESLPNDGLMGHTGERMSCLRKLEKECFPGADTGERMLSEGV